MLLAGSGRGKVGTVAGPGGCAVAKSILRLSGKRTSVVMLDRKLAAGELPELMVQARVRALPGEASGRRADMVAGRPRAKRRSHTVERAGRRASELDNPEYTRQGKRTIQVE